MAMFDPKKSHGDDALPPGEYLIAAMGFDRKQAQTSGNDYLRVRYKVVAGNGKGKTFFSNLSLNTSSSGAMSRLSIFANLCGVEEAFDLDDDRALEKHLMRIPFKAAISRTTENGYTNNGIKRYITDPSDSDKKAMQSWALDVQEEEEMGGGSSGGSSTFSSGDFSDDDIPF